MQTTEYEASLEGAAMEVLESMFFMTVTGSLELPVGLEGDWVRVKLHFDGHRSGDFGVCAPYATARMIAGNFLADDESDVSQIREVFGELSNMICGTFLMRLDGDSAHDLSHPECDLTPIQLQGSTASKNLQLDEGSLCIWTNLEAPHE
jgi:Chemotaxis phosphatase CheX